MNERGGCSVLQISAATGISRPALYRIIETLELEGYVVREANSPTYRLTSRVFELSAEDGARRESR